jgi:hypothetical protein
VTLSGSSITTSPSTATGTSACVALPSNRRRVWSASTSTQGQLRPAVPGDPVGAAEGARPGDDPPQDPRHRSLPRHPDPSTDLGTGEPSTTRPCNTPPGDRCNAGFSGQLGPGCHGSRAALMMSLRQSADGAASRARGLRLPASASVAVPVSCLACPVGDMSSCLMRGLSSGQRRGSPPDVLVSASGASAVASTPVCSSRAPAATERPPLAGARAPAVRQWRDSLARGETVMMATTAVGFPRFPRQ